MLLVNNDNKIRDFKQDLIWYRIGERDKEQP